jgi:hypothetical protein
MSPYQSCANLTLSSATVSASPLAEQGKTFKLGITAGSVPTQYLKANGMGTPNMAEGVDCVIESTQLKCEGKAVGFAFGDMVQLKPGSGGNANGYSVAADGTITWNGTLKNAKFSLKGSGPYEMYAENCPHHTFKRGVAKAYYKE